MRSGRRLLIALAPVLLVQGCGEDEGLGPAASPPSAPAAATRAAYVDTEACAACHPYEAAAWRGSHHDLAMQAAGPESVRGDFDGVTASHSGVSARSVNCGAPVIHLLVITYLRGSGSPSAWIQSCQSTWAARYAR